MAANSLHLAFFFFFFLLLSTAAHLRTTLPENPEISSNSILIALLDSHYTELYELVEKALLLQTLEEAVIKHNLTIFAPKNEAIDSNLDPEFKRFLLEPGNIKSLTDSTGRVTLAHDHLELTAAASSSKCVGNVNVLHFNAVVRPDGIIHGIEKVIVPKSVEREFNNRRKLRSVEAVKPEGAPEVNLRTSKLSKTKRNSDSVEAEGVRKLSVYEAAAIAPSLAPAPGPRRPHHHFDGEKQVKDFIQTLLLYGGYNEMADILVNLTNLATEMEKLISEGYALTVLAPNDEAMAKLTTEQLSEPGAAEQIVYYHIVPEYQTEESMYNAVRRFGTVSYETLRLSHKLVAKEADGSVSFGEGEYSGYLLDPDIYTDGRISVQGIDGVLFPRPEEKKKEVKQLRNGGQNAIRRGKLVELACRMVEAFGQDSRFTTCKGN